MGAVLMARMGRYGGELGLYRAATGKAIWNCCCVECQSGTTPAILRTTLSGISYPAACINWGGVEVWWWWARWHPAPTWTGGTYDLVQSGGEPCEYFAWEAVDLGSAELWLYWASDHCDEDAVTHRFGVWRPYEFNLVLGANVSTRTAYAYLVGEAAPCSAETNWEPVWAEARQNVTVGSFLYALDPPPSSPVDCGDAWGGNNSILAADGEPFYGGAAAVEAIP